MFASPAPGSARVEWAGEWGERLFGGPHLLLSRSLSGLQVDYTAGSLWGSVFNLCSATLGAGCLALPHSLKQMGTVPALALCALTAWASHLSIVLLAECLHACSVRTYEELAVLAFGKNASRIISGSIFLIVFGSAVAYTIAVGDIVNVKFGHDSPVFRSFTFKPHPEWLCFSIVTAERTVSFACQSDDDLATWVCGLGALIRQPLPFGHLLWRRLEMHMKDELHNQGFTGVVTRLGEGLARHLVEHS